MQRRAGGAVLFWGLYTIVTISPGRTGSGLGLAGRSLSGPTTRPAQSQVVPLAFGLRRRVHQASHNVLRRVRDRWRHRVLDWATSGTLWRCLERCLVPHRRTIPLSSDSENCRRVASFPIVAVWEF